SVTATATNTANATAWAVAAGIASGAGADAAATITPTVAASVGRLDNLDAVGDITVAANSTTYANAYTQGISAGAITVGASLSTVHVTPTVTATAGDNARLVAGGSLTLRAVTDDTGITYARSSA